MRVCYTGRCLVAFFGRSALVWRCGEALCVPLKCCAVALGDLVPDQVLRVVQLTLWFLWLCWMLCMLYFAFFSKTNKNFFYFFFIPNPKSETFWLHCPDWTRSPKGTVDAVGGVRTVSVAQCTGSALCLHAGKKSTVLRPTPLPLVHLIAPAPVPNICSSPPLPHLPL